MSHGGPPLFRCVRCGCPATDHATDDEERRECSRCECEQHECAVAPPAPSPDALTRAVEAWREVPERARFAVIRAVLRASDDPALTASQHQAWTAADDLLRAAGGAP